MIRTTTCTRRLLVLGLLLLLAAGVPRASAQAQTKVTVGYLPFVSFAPVFLSIDLGYFKKQGIEVELINFASGATQMAPLSTGELDVAIGGANAGLLNGFNSGMDFKIVADKGQNREGKNYGSLLVIRQDLLAKVKAEGLKALKGQTFTSFAKGSLSDFTLYHYLKHDGVDWKEINLVWMPAPKVFAALQSKAIAGGILVEPWATRAEKQGVGSRYLYGAEVPEVAFTQVAVIMYGGKFIRDKRDLAQRWMNGYLDGVRYYNQHGLQSDSVLEVLEKYTKTAREVIKNSVPFHLDENARVNVQALQHQIDWFFKVGYLRKHLKATDIVDSSFLPK